jgi:hypothetical protein
LGFDGLSVDWAVEERGVIAGLGVEGDRKIKLENIREY